MASVVALDVPAETLTPGIGLVPSVTVPLIVPRGPVVQLGNLNEPIPVPQSARPEPGTYIVVYQNVHWSTGSSEIVL